MITVGGVPLAGEPVVRGLLGVGPFALAPIAAGDEVDPADSEPEAAGYGGVSTSGSPGDVAAWVALAAGSAVRVRVLVGDTIYDDLVVTVAATESSARASCAAGLIPVAPGDLVGLAVQTGSGWTAITVGLTGSLEVTPS